MATRQAGRQWHGQRVEAALGSGRVHPSFLHRFPEAGCPCQLLLLQACSTPVPAPPCLPLQQTVTCLHKEVQLGVCAAAVAVFIKLIKHQLWG